MSFIHIRNWIRSIIHINNLRQKVEDGFKDSSERSAIIDDHIKQLESRTEAFREQVISMTEEITEISKAIGEIREEINSLKENVVHIICSDEKKILTLNNVLSGNPVIWGDEKRLHISKTAAVFHSLFNVNSGDIVIGDYTFAGSNVSFLTGSHDMNLTGLLRRDCAIKEGNDIIIGNGVWIASNATILGPCRIEDDAVVAAGAVVVPGTIIKKNEVFAGIPAKKIHEIRKAEMTIDNENVIRALEREEGVLFVDGWSEKRVAECEGKQFEGHTLLADVALIYSTRENLELLYIIGNNISQAKVLIGEEEFAITKRYGVIKVNQSGSIIIKCSVDSGEGTLFFSAL